MKTFANLIEEVQKPGLCHRCGGCVTFCSAVNYGALELDDNGQPRYKDVTSCIECGICHAICPEIDELTDETRQNVGWKPPIGRILELTIARTTDQKVFRQATDGGVVTGLILKLFDDGLIDGAIVTRPAGPFRREPHLALTREEIINAAGFFFDTSHGMRNYSDKYLTYSTIEAFGAVIKKGVKRLAFVGTPCQIEAVRRMQALYLVPSETIKYCFGLFCSGNFVFAEKQQKQLSKIGGFNWADVNKINIKEDLLLHLNDGKNIRIILDELEFMKRFACYFCKDYAAELADISFGGVGAKDGWTTVVARTSIGKFVLTDAKKSVLEECNYDNSVSTAKKAFKIVTKLSALKKNAALTNRKSLKAHSKTKK